MSIAALASRCALLLTRAQSNQILAASVRLELENVLVRFKIWAGNVGIFAPDKASLEYRLREDADIADVLHSMLTSLERNLKRAVDPPLLEEPEDGGEPPSENSSSSSSLLSLDSEDFAHVKAVVTQGDADTEDAIQKVNDIVDRLYRLAAVFRKPVSFKEDPRVRDFIAQRRQSGDLDELHDIEDHARSHLSARFPRTPKFLVDRLVAAVVFRRMKLRYRQRHQEKLEQGLEPSFGEQPGAGESVRPTGDGKGLTVPDLGSTTEEIPQQPSKPSQQNRRARTVALSATLASSVNRTKFASYARSTALSGITQSATARRQNLDVPPPPRVVDHKVQMIVCPYCFRMIPKDETQEPRWT